MNYHAKFVEEVTERIDDDGDLAVLDQFFEWDGDWNLLHEMPLCEAYAIVKLVIRSGYDIIVRVFSACTNIFPHMMVQFCHCGLSLADYLYMLPYSGPISLVKAGFHISDDRSAKIVKASLDLCARNVGDVFDDTDIFIKYAVVEYSFVVTMLIERGTER